LRIRPFFFFLSPHYFAFGDFLKETSKGDFFSTFPRAGSIVIKSPVMNSSGVKLLQTLMGGGGWNRCLIDEDVFLASINFEGLQLQQIRAMTNHNSHTLLCCWTSPIVA
jgi:hypothetical protein